MASLRLKGKVWYGCITLPGGKRTQVTTKKRDEGTPAERTVQRRQALLIAQSLEDLALGDPTETHIRKTLNYLFDKVGNRARVSRPVDGYFAEWLQRVKLHQAANTHMRYRGIAESFLRMLGSRRAITLTEVTVADVQTWIDLQLSNGKRASSVYSAWQTLGIPFAGALKQGLISTNPVPLAEVPRFSRQPTRFPFTGAQIGAIMQAAEGDWQTVSLLGAFTGARIGDASHMKWAAVDLENGLLRYLPQKTKRTGIEVVIPLHPVLSSHLVRLRETQPSGCEYLCPSLVIGQNGKKPVLTRQFKAILHKAGIATQQIGDAADCGPAGPQRHKTSRYSFHSFRHSFASLLANAGVPREQRMQLIGHTTDHIHGAYSHLALETMRGAIMRLPVFAADPRCPAGHQKLQEPKGPAGPCVASTENISANPSSQTSNNQIIGI